MLTNAVAPALAEWLAARAGWSAVFGTTAGLALVSLLLLVFVHEHRVTPAADAAPLPGLRQTLARPGFPRLLLVAALAGVAFAAAFTFHQPFALSLRIARVSDFLVSYSIAASVVRGPLGSLADRLGRLRVTRFALAAYAFASFATIELDSLGLVASGAAFGVAHGLFYPALNAAALEGSGAGMRGKVTGLFNGAFNVGFSLGSLGLGYVALGFGYAPVFALAGVCSLAALGLLPGRAPEEDAS